MIRVLASKCFPSLICWQRARAWQHGYVLLARIVALERLLAHDMQLMRIFSFYLYKYLYILLTCWNLQGMPVHTWHTL
jgi:hypothetical protein